MPSRLHINEDVCECENECEKKYRKGLTPILTSFIIKNVERDKIPTDIKK